MFACCAQLFLSAGCSCNLASCAGPVPCHVVPATFQVVLRLWHAMLFLQPTFTMYKGARKVENFTGARVDLLKSLLQKHSSQGSSSSAQGS